MIRDIPRYIIAALLLLGGPLYALATAQPAPPPTPEQQVLAQLAAEAWQREASLRVQVLTLQAEIAALKAKATPPPEAPK